jgi:hypothetical protein
MAVSPHPRRKFLAAIAAAPALAAGATLVRPQLVATVAAQSPAADPLWRQIVSDYNQIYAEIATAGTTAESLRALETVQRYHAAAAAAQDVDGQIKRELRRQVNAKGRSVVAGELLRQREHHNARADRARQAARSPRVRAAATIADAEAAIDYALQNGVVAAITASAQATAGLRARKAGIAPARFVRQSPDCSRLRADLDALEWTRNLICFMAFGITGLMPACVAAEALVLLFDFAVSWECDSF